MILSKELLFCPQGLQEVGVLRKYLITPYNLHSQGQVLLENIAKWPRISQQQPKNTAHRAVFRKGKYLFSQLLFS